jgi:hypothetical protein
MKTKTVQLPSGTRQRAKAKNPPQSLLLVLLPMILSVTGGAVGYFFCRGYISRATEIGVFIGYAIGWTIEVSVRVPTETAAHRRADALQESAAMEIPEESAPSDLGADGTSYGTSPLPGHFAAR